jgi:hypothetical protein
MGTNPGTASYSKRQAKRAGGGAVAGGAGGADEALGRSTDINNDPNVVTSDLRRRQQGNDLNAGITDTLLGRVTGSTIDRDPLTLAGLRNTSDLDLRNIVSRLTSSTRDVDRLVPKARALLSSGQPLSNDVRASLNKRLEIVAGTRVNMGINLRRASRELATRPEFTPRFE